MKTILVILILILGFILRFHNYNFYPQRGATSDEYAFAFQGVSLLVEHAPISWSSFSDVYKERFSLTIDRLYFPMVKPYLDHPPLFGLLVGFWSIMNGQDSFEKVVLSTIRLIPIALSTISLLFAFLIGKNLYGFRSGILAMLILATATLFVINQRIVVAESLVTVFLLTLIYLLIKFQNIFTTKRVFLLGIVCGLAFLSKVLGAICFLVVLYFLLAKKLQAKKIFLFVGVFSFFVVTFIAYGVLFDAEVFWAIQIAQGSRSLGPQTLLTFLTTPVIVNKVYYDGWYFFGLLALFVSLLDYKKNSYIFIPALSYLLLLLLTLNQNDLHGWYMLPIFPFMAIASAQLLSEILRKQNWFIFIFLLLVGNSAMQILLKDFFGAPFLFRLFILVMILPFLATPFFKRNNYFFLIANLSFYFFILINILISWNYIHPA